MTKTVFEKKSDTSCARALKALNERTLTVRAPLVVNVAAFTFQLEKGDAHCLFSCLVTQFSFPSSFELRLEGRGRKGPEGLREKEGEGRLLSFICPWPPQRVGMILSFFTSAHVVPELDPGRVHHRTGCWMRRMKSAFA